MKLKEKDNMRTILMTVTLAVLCCSVASAADAAAGKAAYDKSCKSCHGADGCCGQFLNLDRDWRRGRLVRLAPVRMA